ncbi:VanZ family protein [Gammaproteobacteria bacterium]|nr:VanZ family protein [Gammaproteobacteria bacterium]
MTFDQAWERFLGIRYVDLGVHLRADWIANILLYIPLAFLGAAWAHLKLPAQRVSVPRLAGVWLLCVVVALSVEFFQVFFSPRTVSLNDLVAETLGVSLGVAFWVTSRNMLMHGLFEAARGGPTAVAAALYLYLFIYLVLSLFPYDFLVSVDELSWKLSTHRDHLFYSPAACTDTLRCVMKLVAEMFAVVPLGVLLAMRKTSLWRAVLYVGMLGVVVEVLQFFIASGLSQGISVLTRSAGAALGVQAYLWLSDGKFKRYAGAAAPILIVAIIPYLLLLTLLNGWFSNSWLGIGDALPKLNGQMFLPFYYHYFSSEAGALDSVLAALAMYAPFGLGYWIWTVARDGKRSTTPAVLLAAVAALLVEGGKLFVMGKHPDPTNILIAMISAGLAYKMALWVSRSWLAQAYSSTMEQADPASENAQLSIAAMERLPVHEVGWLKLAGTASLLALVGWALTYYPVGASWLTVFLVIYAVTLWHRPALWLFMVPALLPVLDFAVWTGWFFFDEFDLLLMVTLAVLVARVDLKVDVLQLRGYTAWLLALFGVVYSISMLKGVLPLQPLDDNALSGYYSHYNALRVGKGILWAYALLPFLGWACRGRGGLERYFIPGILCGFAATVALAVYERWIFPGLFDFSSDYRATAFFSSMHTGGVSIDAYLALSLPLVASCFLLWRCRAGYFIGLTLYTLGLYAFFVTFSRVNYAAFGVAALMILVGLVRQKHSNHRFFAVALPLSAITALIIVPILLAPYIQARLASTEEDARARLIHWEETLALRDIGLISELFGMGVGSFPRVYFWADPGPSRPASFAYASEGGNTFLRLGSGRPLYIIQRIQPNRAEQYQVRLDLRAHEDAANLSVTVCEKSLLYSLRCESETLNVSNGQRGWQTRQAGLTLRDFGARGRPVFLALYNGRAGTVVDIDNVSLQGPGGSELIANGEFASGSDRWFFTSDDHLSWHVNNVWVYILFEQGWLGLVLFALIVLLALIRLAKCAWSGDPMSLILLAALGAGLTVGMTGSILGAPRIALFLFLLLFASFLHKTAGGYSDAGRQSNSPKNL